MQILEQLGAVLGFAYCKQKRENIIVDPGVNNSHPVELRSPLGANLEEHFNGGPILGEHLERRRRLWERVEHFLRSPERDQILAGLVLNDATSRPKLSGVD